MTLTNTLELPEALVNACETAPHNLEGNVSVTTLKNGVREILLTKRHWKELTDDVSNRIWAIFGTAVHSLLEKESPDTFVEESFSLPVGKYKVTGRVDCYDMKNHIIYDYKTASTWKYKFNDFSDWRFQGLAYAWLMKKAGFEVHECRFVAMFKDFSPRKARLEKDYPPSPVYVYRFPVDEAGLKEVEEYITSKVKLLEESENIPDEQLPLCTDEERWARGRKFALMKKGRKTAIKLYDSKEEAEKAKTEESMYVEERVPEDGKCDGYCLCRDFCPYWKQKEAPAADNGLD